MCDFMNVAEESYRFNMFKCLKSLVVLHTLMKCTFLYLVRLSFEYVEGILDRTSISRIGILESSRYGTTYIILMHTCVPCTVPFLSVSSINKIPRAWSFQNSPFVLWRAKVTMSIAPSRHSRDLSTNFWRLSHLANLKRSGVVPGGNQAPSPATGIFKQNR